MNVENILKVAQAIEDAAKPEAKPKIGFNMTEYVGNAEYDGPDLLGHGCETVCCIAGWAVSSRGTKEPKGRGDDIGSRARRRLGLSANAADALFRPLGITEWREILPAHAVAVLRHLAATGEVDWTVGAPTGGEAS